MTKKELQAQIELVDHEITKFQDRQVPTIEEDRARQEALQKLQALRTDLLDKLKTTAE